MATTKVDLRELDLDTTSSSPGWEAACAAVTASMAAHGCVVIACSTLSPELRQALFNRAMPELFALPVEAKQRNAPTAAFRGYVGQVPGWDYESLEIQEVSDTKSVRDFSNLLWPQGNPEFCDTIMASVRKILEVQQMVERITLDGLGVREESIAAHFQTLTQSLRLSHYGAAETGAVALPAHTDVTVITGIVQHEVGGLEVQAKDGSWVTIAPETDTITFLAGETFTVLTNGRVPACLHRVKTLSDRDRFSLLLNSVTKKGAVVSALDELVDQENHPLMYNPLRTDEYTVFRFSEQGMKSSNPLKDFCGADE